MNETIEPTAEVEPIEPTAADEQEAVSEAFEAEEDKDTPEPEQTPQKPKKEASPSMEERMLEMLLKEKHPDTLATALANGKTIRGAWNYVVSVMKNAYIAQNGKVSGGMCGTPDVVVGIAERYLREFPEGTVEPEVAHTPKKKDAPPKAELDRAKAAAKVASTVKNAAKDAKAEAKRKHDEMMKEWATQQLSFGF